MAYDAKKRQERYRKNRKKILIWRKRYHKQNRDRENAQKRAAYDPAKRRERYLRRKESV